MINKITVSLIALVIITLIIFGYVKKDSINSYFGNKDQNKLTEKSTSPSTETSADKNKDLSKLNLNNIFKPKNLPNNDGWETKTSFKNVGSVASGKYKGYTRILLTIERSSNGKPNSFYYYLFATNDFEKFIAYKDPKHELDFYYVDFSNPSNITFDTFPFNLPTTIDIDENYSLISSMSDYVFESYVDMDTYLKFKNFYLNNSSEFKKINNYDVVFFNDFNDFFINDGGVYVRYILTPKYKAGVTLNYTEGTGNNKSVVNGFTFNNPLNSSIKFRKYDYHYVGAVALSGLSTVKLPDSDLELLTDAIGPKIYRVKNTNNSVYKESLVNSYKGSVSKTKDSVNYDLNIKNGAILLMKDPFGSYIYLFESEKTERMMGGGKPVIYLYPENNTKISLKFNEPMTFNNVVPNFFNEWLVEASSTGLIKDLKPELTNCNEIKITSSTTYAKEACLKNEYPYLYWSGGVYSTYKMPVFNDGFVVERDNLSSFFDQKLSLIGFTQKEIADFKEFWVPELESKSLNYFTIRFLQNDELSRLFPMTVTPKPDSQIRIFMDWNGYNYKPEIREQNLVSYERKGFVLTEWGGLKK